MPDFVSIKVPGDELRRGLRAAGAGGGGSHGSRLRSWGLLFWDLLGLLRLRGWGVVGFLGSSVGCGFRYGFRDRGFW